jgi:hypothetical protein
VNLHLYYGFVWTGWLYQLFVGVYILNNNQPFSGKNYLYVFDC